MKKSLIALELCCLTALSICTGSLIASEAVSKPNGKISLYGASIDNSEAGNISGSLAFPLNDQLGAQIDGVLGTLEDEMLYGGAGHLFWRDPTRALLGMTATYVRWYDLDVWRIGAEAEAYIQQATLAAQIGNQAGDLGDALYTSASLRYYLADENLMIAAGGSQLDGQNQFFADLEYQTALNGLSLFAGGAIGEDNYELFLGGLRFYFGEEKTLMLRHREDDPFNPVFNTLNASLNAIKSTAQNRRPSGNGSTDANSALPPPTPPTGSVGPEVDVDATST